MQGVRGPDMAKKQSSDETSTNGKAPPSTRKVGEEKRFQPTAKMMKDPDPKKRRAAFVAWMLENARQCNRTFPDDVGGISGMLADLTIGVRVPCLVMQYQLQSNVLPLGRLYAVVGK